MEIQYCLYVLKFDDGRIKFGITKNINQRMSYYRQEARRNNIDFIVWYATESFKTKSLALYAERMMKFIYRDFTRKSQREWIIDHVDYETVINKAIEIRLYIGNESGIDEIEVASGGSTGCFKGITTCY